MRPDGDSNRHSLSTCPRPKSHTPLLQQTKERFVHPVFPFGGWSMDELSLEQAGGTCKTPNKIIMNQIAFRQEPRPCNFTESSFSSFSAPNRLQADVFVQNYSQRGLCCVLSRPLEAAAQNENPNPSFSCSQVSCLPSPPDARLTPRFRPSISTSVSLTSHPPPPPQFRSSSRNQKP